MICNQFTEKEKRELIVNTLDKNFFVEAGAGAGKTSLIVSRIVNQLKAGIKPREIVAITFTNAASRELRERIIKEVHEESLTCDLAEAVATIDQMHISTIHSFCNRLLKERSIDANMPLELTLLEEEALTKLKDDSFLHFAETLKKNDWDVLIKAGKYRRGVLERLRSMTDQVISASDDTNFAVALPDVSENDFYNGIDPFIDYLKTKLISDYNYAYADNVDDIESIINSCSAYGKKMCTALINGDRLEIAQQLVKIPPFEDTYILKPPTQTLLVNEQKRADRKNVKDLQNEIKTVLLSTRSYIQQNLRAIKILLGGYENSMYRPYIEYAKRAADYFFSQLPSGVLYNDLLIQSTDRMLRESIEARRYLADKFKCIYVDEFQDTDHIQERLITTLCKELDSDNLRDGALFVVGDPKQSIYRFRGAEPDIYFATKNKMEAMDNAYTVELSDNYRSNNLIIDWVNNEFAYRNITNGNAYIPMNAVNTIPVNMTNPDLFAGMYIYKSPNVASASADIKTDALAVKDLILNLVNGNYYIIDYDTNRNPVTRRIKYSDFLIMCTYMKGMETYAETLKVYGIPFVMDAQTNLSTHTVLNNICKAYDYLVNPYAYEKQMALSEGLFVMLNNQSVVDKVMHIIKKDTEEMSDRGKLIYLRDNSELFLAADTDYSEADITDIESKITQMVESVISSAPTNGMAVLQALKDYIGSSLEHQLRLDDDMDAVRFMNLHKAKGLEGNIVLWVNRQENAIYFDGAYREGNDLYPCIKYNIGDRATTAWIGYNRDDTVRDRAVEADRAEKIRLEYVACTRAKQAFVFMDIIKEKKQCLFTGDYHLSQLPSVESIVDENDNPQPEFNGIETDLNIKRGDVACDDSKNALFVSHSPSEYEDESAGNPTKAPVIKSKLRRPYGGVFGTVMHRSLELLVNRITLTTEKMNSEGLDAMKIMDACYRQAINENLLDIPSAEIKDYEIFIHEVLLAYIKWWYAEKMPENVEKAYTELGFSYFYNNNDEGNIWMHGTADLVLLMKDGSYVIIDYKSDIDDKYANENDFEERLRGKYTGQIEAYKKSVSRMFEVDSSTIKARIISFTERELAKGDNLRVRVTNI